MRNLAAITVLATFIGAITGASAAAESTEREIVVDGATRSYLIHVPKAWDRARPLPVLFVFHGAGSDAESMVRATGFDGMAAGTNMIVVYPRAPSPVLRYEVDPPAGRDSADVRLVDALLERLRARFPVDSRRIWATGFSNGAAFCYRLAAERPRVIAAMNVMRTAIVARLRTATAYRRMEARIVHQGTAPLRALGRSLKGPA